MVRFTRVEKLIIDSPYFQRLRRVKQLALANLVFPGAEHTRFSHSIGTMAVAGRVCDKLELKNRDTQLVRIAALLHDIGHLPFSHMLEDVYEKKRDKETPSETPTAEAPSAKVPGVTKNRASDSKPPETDVHEGFSARIAEEILKGLSSELGEFDIKPDEISCLIVGKKYATTSKNQENEKYATATILQQVIHSDLDVDKMDYLLRDEKHTGTVYGIFNIDYLIDSLRKVQVPETKQYILAVDISGLRTVEDFVLARYFYYTQILYHKIRVVVEEVAKKLYNILLDEEDFDFPKTYKELEELVGTPKFYQLDDMKVMEAFKRVAYDETLSKSLKNPCATILAKSLFDRSFPKLKHERLVLNFDENVSRKLESKAPKDACFELYIPSKEKLKLYSRKSKKFIGWPPEEIEINVPNPIKILYDPEIECDLEDGVEVVVIEKGETKKKKILLLSEFPNTLAHKLRDHTLLIERVYQPRNN